MSTRQIDGKIRNYISIGKLVMAKTVQSKTPAPIWGECDPF